MHERSRLRSGVVRAPDPIQNDRGMPGDGRSQGSVSTKASRVPRRQGLFKNLGGDRAYHDVGYWNFDRQAKVEPAVKNQLLDD